MKEPKIKVPANEVDLIRVQFTDLQRHPAWARVVAFLDQKIAYLHSLLENKEIKDLAELELIRAKIKLCTQFRNTPEILSTYEEVKDGVPVEFDPYE